MVGAVIIVGTVIVVGVAMVIVMVSVSGSVSVVMAFIVVLTRCGTARLPKEREVGRPSHVRRGHEGTNQRNVVEELVAVVAGVIDDLVFRKEPREERDTAQRSGRHHPCGRRDRHLLRQTTHVFLHVE